MMPLVSVCIPTYNSSKYLKEAINSVITQGFNEFELIIVDNHSNDDTDDIVYSFNDKRIRYYKNSQNIGAIDNHNKCIDLSNGKFIKFLCSDDVLLPNVIYDQVTCLLKHSKVALVTCDMYITDYSLQNKIPYHFYPGMNKGDRIVKKCIAESINYIGGPSNVMFRKDAVGKIRMDPT